MERDEHNRKIQAHLDAIRQLQTDDIAPLSEAEIESPPWPPRQYYWLFHVLVGMMLGFLGATVSLVINIVGSLLVNQHPLQIIRVYLTFPMGEEALTSESGKVLFVGCVLYLITGGLYGIAFHLIMSLRFARAPFKTRFIAASVIGLALWIVNFYFIISWLQPVLLGGSWIITEMPFYVAAITHLAFGWTMLAVEGWGRFESGIEGIAGNGNAMAAGVKS